jgi:hypothetical protein
MERILRTVFYEPVDITYVGIGSSPHLTADQLLQPKYDQLVPQCFHEFLLKDKKHIRIIHFDPDFANCVEFLHVYFEKWNLLPMEFSEGMSWIGENLEVLVIPERIDHDEQFWFFQQLCDSILQTKGKLVIQEFTGYDVQPLNRKLYEATENKELFKRRILIDMTYGTDIGCSTDMTKAQPFYDFDLNFLNLHFMTDEDAKRWVHVSLKLDAILKQKYIAKYLQLLNNIHVDYRRRLKGEPCMFGHPNYTDSSTPDEIMRVLETSLQLPIEILLGLQVLGKEDVDKIKNFYANAKTMDPYKWYDAMRKVIPFFS